MHANLMNRSFWLTVASGCTAFGLATSAPRADADGAIAEPAIARTADDAGLPWGGCPGFLPAGCSIAVLHGDPAAPNADILFRVPGHTDIAPHTHTSAERMVLVAGELFVTYEGQAETHLTPGTYAYGPAGRPHRGRCVSEAPCVLVIAFEDPVDAMPVAAGDR